jgi:hypothetical protein
MDTDSHSAGVARDPGVHRTGHKKYRISNIEQGMMNVEGKSRIDEPVHQGIEPRILPFIIRCSLFGIHHLMNATQQDRSVNILPENEIWTKCLRAPIAG